MAEDVPDYVKEQGPEYVAWWVAREKLVEAHQDDPGDGHIDKYVVTVEYEVRFSQEHDGVLNEHDVEMWLRTGDVDWGMGESKILKVRKGAI